MINEKKKVFTIMIPYTFDNSGMTSKNVMDDFINMNTDCIREELDKGRSQMISVCMNLTSDFNKASVIRSNNAFLGNEVILVGKRRFDRRGTVGTHHYENIVHSYDIDEVFEYLRINDYTTFAVDNTPSLNPEVIYDVYMPEKSAFFYGEEQQGLSEEIASRCDKAIYIPQYGSVRSVNVASAASIVMSEYTRRHRR